MRYNPNYDFEMTTDEERYLEQLKKFDTLKQSADKVAHFIEYNSCFFCFDASKSFCRCDFKDGVLTLEICLAGTFKHTPTLSSTENFCNFFDWATQLPCPLSKNQTDLEVSWHTDFVTALRSLYKSYMDFWLS